MKRNWVSTTEPLYQILCDELGRKGAPFELRNATTQEHFNFVDAFAARHGLMATKKGATVYFELHWDIDFPGSVKAD